MLNPPELLENYITHEVLDNYLRLLAQQTKPSKGSCNDDEHAFTVIKRLIDKLRQESAGLELPENLQQTITRLALWITPDIHEIRPAIVSSFDRIKRIAKLVSASERLLYCNRLSIRNWPALESLHPGDTLTIRICNDIGADTEPVLLEVTPTKEPVPESLLKIVTGRISGNPGKNGLQKFVTTDAEPDWLDPSFVKQHNMVRGRQYKIKMIATCDLNKKLFGFKPISLA